MSSIELKVILIMYLMITGSEEDNIDTNTTKIGQTKDVFKTTVMLLDRTSTVTTTTLENQGKANSISTRSDLMTSTNKTDNSHYLDEDLKSGELPWWFKDALKDIAYYLRAHKFNEYDRRYNRNGSGVERTNYKYFPKPPLRALHWEVNKYCESSFLHCVDYLRKKLKHVALRRQDDTSIVVQENGSSSNATAQMSFIDMECRRMRNVDDKVAPPFEGPLERYQWRTTASYFMCWYTMNKVPNLEHLDEKCDNFAYCLDLSLGPNTDDPRADDSKPFACAQYSFCPDPCCANKHLRHMDFCWNNQENPCFQGNSIGQRDCVFNRTQNTDFGDLIMNRWNVTCKCPKPGYVWSSMYGICTDVDECVSSESHGCTSEGQTCMNLPGSFECICNWGYIYSDYEKKCIKSDALTGIKLGSEQKKKNITINKWKIFMKTVVRVLGKSSSSSVIKRLEPIFQILSFLIVQTSFNNL